MVKVFISYTTRDGQITKDILQKIDKIFYMIDGIEAYIDMLHNTNMTNPQKCVMKHLKNADVVLVIESKDVFLSPWVKKEICFATKNNLPLYFIDIPEITKHRGGIVNSIGMIVKNFL